MAGQTYLSQFIPFGSIDIAIILAACSFCENYKLQSTIITNGDLIRCIVNPFYGITILFKTENN